MVTRDGTAAQLSDIKRGNHVWVTTNPDGSVQRIDATRAKGRTSWKWLAPLLGPLVLGALRWFLLGRRKRDATVLEPAAPRGTGAGAPARWGDSFVVAADHRQRPRRSGSAPCTSHDIHGGERDQHHKHPAPRTGDGR